MRFLIFYREQINKFGGFGAVRDNNALLSVIANPQREFAGKELYPTVASKAAIVVYSLIKNHPLLTVISAPPLFGAGLFCVLNAMT